jgi:hypothetical protein
MSLIYEMLQAVRQNCFMNYLYELSKSIIEVKPFYLVQEDFIDKKGLKIAPKIDLDKCEIGLLKISDMKEISEEPEVNQSEDEFVKRLKNSWLCLGVRNKGKIISFMWCNLKECNSKDLSFKLKENEAYITDARTLKAYRGKKLAPFLRVQLYRHLREIGRTKSFSITGYFNKPALKFKEKLNAKPIKLYLGIRIVKKLHLRFVLKTYEPCFDLAQSEK